MTNNGEMLPDYAEIYFLAQLCVHQSLTRLAFVVSGPQVLNAFYWQFMLVRLCYGSGR